MKNIRLSIAAFGMATLFIGCDKFLERPPAGSIDEETALQTEADVLSLVNSCYYQLGMNELYNGKLQATVEYMADELNGTQLTGKPQEIFNRSTTIFNTDNASLYTGAYNVIYRSNKVLEKLELVSEANRPRVEAMAKLIRAICHFEVVRLWAYNPGYTADNSHPGIPIRTSTEISIPQRASVKAVYDQIILDLKDAESKFPNEDATRLYGDKNTARAFLAKVYFQMNNFTEAYNYSNQVIQSGKYPLETALKTRYSPTGTTESILRVSLLLGTHEPGGSLRGSFSGRNNPPAVRFSRAFYNMVNEFSGDRRIQWLDSTKFPNAIFVTKYDSSYFELPLLSITEMYLTRAEAAGEIANTNTAALATGIQDINKIIERAYGNNSNNLLSTASADLLINTVRQQREIELMGEGDRLHQITRIGAHPNPARRNELLDKRGSFWNCPGFLLQFPDYEKNANASFVLNVEGGCF